MLSEILPNVCIYSYTFFFNLILTASCTFSNCIFLSKHVLNWTIMKIQQESDFFFDLWSTLFNFQIWDFCYWCLDYFHCSWRTYSVWIQSLQIYWEMFLWHSRCVFWWMCILLLLGIVFDKCQLSQVA